MLLLEFLPSMVSILDFKSIKKIVSQKVFWKKIAFSIFFLA